MNTENCDSGTVQGLLKSLCQNNGWSYAVLWCFDHRNSSMLTMKNAYNEEQMSILIDNMLLQVHVLGTGIVGQTVSSMQNRWMFSDDDDCIEQNSIRFNNQDVLQNDRDDIHCQFSYGIKTIAFIPLEMQGVVQFGSTQKIYETQEFVFQTKQLLRANETTNIDAGFNHLEKTLSNNSSSNSDIFDEVFSSLISSTKDDFFSFGSDLQLTGSFHPETDPFSHSVSSSNMFDLLPSSAVPFINQEHSEQMTSFYSVPNGGFSNESVDLFDGLADIVMPLNNENCLDFGDNLGFLSNERSMNSIFKETEQDLVSSSVISNYNLNKSVNCILPPKKSKEEPLRHIKKRAKPGTRPKPKDRVQIRERIAELRKLVPNSGKTSIDSLLAQTVKHVLFLEGITKHAETMKRANEHEDRQSMTEPICVKDLNAPGQMMIEIHFNETDCFADIVEIIHGFDLTILKGNMQTKGNKLRACFIVEAEANRHVTKQHIYVSLIRFLNQKASCNMNMNVADNRFSDNWHQTVESHPFSFAEALF